MAVLPFHVTAPDSTYDYLGEGVVDLAGILLTGGEGTPRTVDPRAILTAYHRLQRVPEEDLTIEQRLTLARRFGAAHLVTGELVITRDGSTMNARLIDASSGGVVATLSLRDQPDPGPLADEVQWVRDKRPNCAPKRLRRRPAPGNDLLVRWADDAEARNFFGART